MKRVIMFVLLFAALKVAGQTTGYLRFDTVRVMKQNGTCELYIINKTKDSLGLLTNIGGGLTQFKRSRVVNDSTIIIGLDTLIIKGTGSGGGSISDGDKGDITVSSSGTVWTIDNNAVTNAKLRQSAGLSVIGRSANTTGNVADITATTPNTFLGYDGSTVGFFAASGAVQQYNTSYVDSALGNDGTGIVNRLDKPFATINAGLDALPSTGGIIDIAQGGYLVPDTGKIKSNVWFRGHGMPHYNDTTVVGAYFSNGTTTPTRMIGGTRLHGFFSIPHNRNNVDMSDLGVDNGSEWINANNGGVALDCVGYAQKYGAGLNSADGFHLLQTSAQPRTGIDVWNVSVLVKEPTSSVHGFIFENMLTPSVHDIYSCHGFAGIVIKTMGGVFKGLHARAHSDAGIYLKSNDYSHCYGVTLDGFEITSIGSNDGGGLHINSNDAGSPGIYFCSVSNGVITNTKYGIKSVGSIVDNFGITNCIAAAIQGNGFDFQPMYYSLISNNSARSCGGDGFKVVNGGAGKGPFISNCFAASNGGDGFDITGTFRSELNGTFTELNTGYGINAGTNVFVGLHTDLSNTAGATNGTINTNNTVANGGIGTISLTPYALMLGGTTSTGPVQQVTALGTAGDVLTSNGAGAAPTFQAAGGGGITSINSETGPGITIQGGTGTIASTTANTVTVEVVPSSTALVHPLTEFYTDANNTGTGETDLYTYTAPSNTVPVDGQKISFEFAGLFNDATATSNLQVYFAGTGIGGTGVISVTGTGAWTAKGYIIRTSSSTIRSVVTFTIENSTAKIFTTIATVSSIDFTAANILKITGTAGGGSGGSNDITAKLGHILFIPIPI